MDMIDRILARHEAVTKGRWQFDDLWESTTEILLPRRMGFTSEWTPGAQKTERLFDTSPMLAARGLASTIDGLIKPKQTQWFEIETDDDALMRDSEVAEWLYDSERRLFKEIYRPQARWMQATGEADADIVVIGNAFVLCTENTNRDGFLFRTTHMKDTHFVENADGAVDTVHLTERTALNVAAQRWGYDNLSEASKELIRNDKGHEKVKFIQVIEPRNERDPRRTDAMHKPWRYCVIEADEKHKVLESGMDEFPGGAVRWDTTAGETYGRGPGTLALPDAQTCQQIKKTLLKAGHRAVDPPWIAARNQLLGPAQNRPGGLTYFDPVEAGKFGNDPVKQLDSRAQLPFGLELLQQEREEVAAAFYRNILNLPVDGPDMTATEVIQRREEFVREIGAVFGRLETEYITPLVERAFAIMMRRSLRMNFSGPMTFRKPPDVLQGHEIRFKFSSPIDKAKRQIESAQTRDWLLRVLEMAKVEPEIKDIADFDAALRFDAESNDVAPVAVRSPDEVQALREHRDQQRQIMENLAGAEQAAGAANSGAAAVKQLADAAGGMAA